MEKQKHLFFRCEFPSDIWNNLQRWKPGLFSEQPTLLVEFMEEVEQRTKGASCWGLAWMVIGAVTWTMWTERNKRVHEQRYMSTTELTRCIKEDISTVFQRCKYKGMNMRTEEQKVAKERPGT